MRKKSHISLAQYIVYSLNETELVKHRKAFYIGSILPDCKPSFLTKRHEFNGTFDEIKEEIGRLTSMEYKQNFRSFCRDVGQVIHYIADYFTFPHNAIYEGNLKDHCRYEKHLKIALSTYIKKKELEKAEPFPMLFYTPQALCMFIRERHQEYLQLRHTLQEDCSYIVSLCQQVVHSLFFLLANKEHKMALILI